MCLKKLRFLINFLFVYSFIDSMIKLVIVYFDAVSFSYFIFAMLFENNKCVEKHITTIQMIFLSRQ